MNIYVTNQNGVFAVSKSPVGAVCTLLEPVCIENGCEITVPFLAEENGLVLYRDDKNEVTLTVEQKSETLFYLLRTWKNITAETRSVRIAQRIKP